MEFRTLEPDQPAQTPRRSAWGRWSARRPWAVPAFLFLLTIATTTLANGPLYSAAIMGILLFHEMGHYRMCLRYQVPATLPHFIPLPPQVSLMGTLGAVIRMRANTADRRVLFDIGIAGPLAGFVVAVPVTIFGLAHSTVLSGPPGAALYLGESLIFVGLQHLVIGPVGSQDVVMLHPVALAGWTGLLVTGLNLLPVGMLDGGHISYGLLGRRSIWLAAATMVGIAVLAASIFPGWWVWLALLLLLRVAHPAARMASRPLDRRRRILGLLALVLFVACFVPAPIRFQP